MTSVAGYLAGTWLGGGTPEVGGVLGAFATGFIQGVLSSIPGVGGTHLGVMAAGAIVAVGALLVAALIEHNGNIGAALGSLSLQDVIKAAAVGAIAGLIGGTIAFAKKDVINIYLRPTANGMGEGIPMFSLETSKIDDLAVIMDALGLSSLGRQFVASFLGSYDWTQWNQSWDDLVAAIVAAWPGDERGGTHGNGGGD